MAIDSDDDWEESNPSPFAGRIPSADPDKFRRSGRPIDRWLVAAEGFVEVLNEWISLDTEDHEYFNWGPDGVIRQPPERTYWIPDGSRLRFAGVKLETFKEDTATIVGNILIDPDIKAIDHTPLIELIHLIEAAYLEAEKGSGFLIDPIQLCWDRAKLICMAVRTAFDQRKARDAVSSNGPKTSPSVMTLVTLLRASAMVHKKKRTLERYKANGKLPSPVIDGGGGRPDYYDWEVMRLWLEATFGITMPHDLPDPGRK